MSLLVTIVGPTAAGKRSVIKELVAKNFAHGATAVTVSTTRPRPEGGGRMNYHHLSDELFTRQVRAGSVVECAMYGPHRYGINLMLLERQFEMSRLLLVGASISGWEVLSERIRGEVRVLSCGLVPRFVSPTTPDFPSEEYDDRCRVSGYTLDGINRGKFGLPIENNDGRLPDAVAQIQKRIDHAFLR